MNMPSLATSLRAFELDQLQQIALLWGLESDDKDKLSLLLTLELHISQPDHFLAFFGLLPEPAQQALVALQNNNGKLPWSTFVQRFGEIRALGKSLRKKEQPWAFPASTSELLWYHGLLGRDFLRQDGDLQEMAYLPDEVLPLLPSLPDRFADVTLTPLPSNVAEGVHLAGSEILDTACLLLAALRFDKPEDYLNKTTIPPSKLSLLESLLLGTGILNQERQATDSARGFLELPRALALKWLANQWLKSSSFQEVNYLPGLQIEGCTPLRSLEARRTIINALNSLQAECWYRLDEFVALLKSTKPDFLRQQEDYFSWTILKDGNLQQPLSGFESWVQVEGELINFFVNQMLPELALVDIATHKETPSITLFKLKKDFFTLNSPTTDPQEEPENAPMILNSTGRIQMTDRSPRLARYQISRFVEWEQVSPSHGTYQVTPRSLSKAKEQGLLPKHLIQLLRKHAEGGLPPILYEAIKRWEAEGTQASLQTQTVLRLSSPEILQALRESPAAHWLGESLGPTTVIVKPSGEKAVLNALSSLGYLSDYNESENNNA